SVFSMEPLSPAEGLELAQQLLGPERAEEAEGVQREASGNPFFIEEIVQLEPRGLQPKSPTVEQTVLARVGELRPEVRRLLEIVSVAGISLPLSVAVRATKLRHDTLPAIHQLLA